MNTMWLELPHDWVAGFQGTRPGRGQQSRGLTVFFNLVLGSPAGALLPGSVTELMMKVWPGSRERKPGSTCSHRRDRAMEESVELHLMWPFLVKTNKQNNNNNKKETCIEATVSGIESQVHRGSRHQMREVGYHLLVKIIGFSLTFSKKYSSPALPPLSLPCSAEPFQYNSCSLTFDTDTSEDGCFPLP